jgi:hypothetical protein
MPLATHQRLQPRETSSPVLLGREYKGVVVAVVVVETALPWRQRLHRSSQQWYVVKACRERCGSGGGRWPGGAPGPPLLVHVVVVVAAALGGFPCRCNVPQVEPASSSRVRMRMTVRTRRSSWADTGCSVAWDPLLPSLRRWLATNGSSRIPLQIHKRKHQPVSRTPARGREGPFSRNLSPLVTEMQSPATTTSCISVCTRSSTSYRAQSVSTVVVQSSWALRVHADVDRTKQWGAGKRRDGIKESGAGHAEPQRG